LQLKSWYLKSLFIFIIIISNFAHFIAIVIDELYNKTIKKAWKIYKIKPLLILLILSYSNTEIKTFNVRIKQSCQCFIFLHHNYLVIASHRYCPLLFIINDWIKKYIQLSRFSTESPIIDLVYRSAYLARWYISLDLDLSA